MQARALESEAYFIKPSRITKRPADENTKFSKQPIQQAADPAQGPTAARKRGLWNTWPGLQRPLITVSCHDDLTALTWSTHLVKGGETTWVDGPLTRGRTHWSIVIWMKSSKT